MRGEFEDVALTRLLPTLSRAGRYRHRFASGYGTTGLRTPVCPGGRAFSGANGVLLNSPRRSGSVTLWYQRKVNHIASTAKGSTHTPNKSFIPFPQFVGIPQRDKAVKPKSLSILIKFEFICAHLCSVYHIYSRISPSTTCISPQSRIYLFVLTCNKFISLYLTNLRVQTHHFVSLREF